MPNKISSLLKKGDQQFFKNYRKNENKLLGAYRRSLDEIRLKINSLYEKFEFPTITEVRKFNRLVNLEKQITEEINRLNRVISNTTAADIKAVFGEAYYSTGFAVEVGTGVNLGFTALPKEAIKFAAEDNLWLDLLKNKNAELLSNIKLEVETMLRQNARQEIVAGLSQGKSYPQISKAIKDRFDITAGRANRITATEMHKNYNFGRVEGIKKATDSANRLGIKTVKVWRHNPGAKTPRPDHVQMDGVEADENGIFTLPDGTTTEAPGLTGDPAHDVFCFDGSVNVISPSKIQKVMKRYYEGDLIEITTACGINITGTPNHPIMSTKGFVALNSLNEGSDVLYASLTNNSSFINPKINNTETQFSKMFDFFSVCFPNKRIGCVKEDFHGDGFIEDVNIININSFLGNAHKIVFSKPFSKFFFSFANLAKSYFPSFRFFAFFFKRSFSANVRKMSVVCNFFLLFFSHLRRVENRPVFAVASCNVILNQNSFNNISGSTKFFGNSLFRSPVFIKTNNFFGIFFNRIGVVFVSFIKYFRPSSFFNIVSSKKLNKCTLANLKDVRKFFLGNTGIIKRDKIISIKRFKFSGHVYNLQTEKSFYLVQNNIHNPSNIRNYIIAHNCGCTAEFEVKNLEGIETDEDLQNTSYEDWKSEKVGA